MAQANVIKNESVIALTAETTEGVATDPSGSGDYIEVLSDGVEATLEREEISRDLLGGSIETEASRVGIKSVSATLPVELRASSSAGEYPEPELLFESLLGGKRQNAADTTTTGNTSTVLEFGATPSFDVGDIVLVKESGAYEMRPISAVGATTITFPFALEGGAPADGVEVEKVSTFYHSDPNATDSLTVTHYAGDEIKQQLSGMRVGSMSLEGWETGQISTCSFSLSGLNMTEADGSAPHTPSFDTSLPPITLSACLWVNGTKLQYNAFTLNVENTLNPVTSACSANGRIASRYTQQVVTGTINPYLDDSTTTLFDNFNDNDDVSIFLYAYNPTSSAGEFGEAVGIWIPQAKFTARAYEDINGVYAENLTFRAHRNTGDDSVFISFV